MGALIALLVPAVAAAEAEAAAAPVLEFAVPGNDFPVAFEADGGEVTAALADANTEVHCAESEGDGEIVSPRMTLSSYVFKGCEAANGPVEGATCQSEDADPGEIRSVPIEAQLVFIDQAKREVGMLLNPAEGIYISFECEDEPINGRGAFLSPVGQINEESTSFTASLTRSGATQTPSEYETALGEKRVAIPQGQRNGNAWVTTGVELDFAIETSRSIEIKAITAAEVEAKQRADDEAAAAAAKKRDEDAAAAEAAARKRQAEEAALAAVVKLREEEEAKVAQLKRARQLSKGLTQCRKAKKKQKRARCEKRVKRKHAAARRA